MPWKECNQMDERLKFIARLLDGEKMAVLCRQFGISRKTGYKILTYNEIGLEGLTDRSRRPYRHANRLPVQIETRIVRLKQDKSSWGAPWKPAQDGSRRKLSACTAAGFPSRLERRPTAAFQWLRRRGPLCWLRKELGNVDGQRLGEAIEQVDGRVFLLPLQAADVRRFSHTWKSHRRDRTGWLGRHLGMAESKSKWFALFIKAYSEKSRKFDLHPIKRLAGISE